jgi:tetratricopeptide (TPR) repeat protein
MRSAERHFPRALVAPVALAALLLAGCGSIGLRTGADAPASATSASNPASAPSRVTPASAPVARAIAPATQRAYDDAVALLRAGRTADAERAFRSLAQAEPDLAGAHANLGLIARQAGRLPEAQRELETATTLAPTLAAAWNQLGLAYRQQGEFAKAKAAYDSALAADPSYANAVLNLGVLQDLYLGDAPQALALYTRYLALVPGGDRGVAKWVAEVKNRKPAPAASAPAPAAAPKEKS